MCACVATCIWFVCVGLLQSCLFVVAWYAFICEYMYMYAQFHNRYM